jgi:hypothetical protein
MAAWFSAQPDDLLGSQLYKLGSDGSVTQWTALPGFPVPPNDTFGLNPLDLTFFNDAVWFNGQTPANGSQLFKLGNDGSVTKWTALASDPGDENPGLNPLDLTFFNNALWFNGDTPTTGEQLFKLGSDGSVTKWTANLGGGFGLSARELTVFNDALWFSGDSANGFQLYKLGNDGSVTQWTAGGSGSSPQGLTAFNDALWFRGISSDGFQLYKLGNDGSVTKWTANLGNAAGLVPSHITAFNDALWFSGQTPANGFQLYKLGNDGSVTLWTKIGTGLGPKEMTVFDNAL